MEVALQRLYTHSSLNYPNQIPVRQLRGLNLKPPPGGGEGYYRVLPFDALNRTLEMVLLQNQTFGINHYIAHAQKKFTAA